MLLIAFLLIFYFAWNFVKVCFHITFIKIKWHMTVLRATSWIQHCMVYLGLQKTHFPVLKTPRFGFGNLGIVEIDDWGLTWDIVTPNWYIVNKKHRILYISFVVIFKFYKKDGTAGALLKVLNIWDAKSYAYLWFQTLINFVCYKILLIIKILKNIIKTFL